MHRAERQAGAEVAPQAGYVDIDFLFQAKVIHLLRAGDGVQTKYVEKARAEGQAPSAPEGLAALRFEMFKNIDIPGGFLAISQCFQERAVAKIGIGGPGKRACGKRTQHQHEEATQC